MTMTIEPKQLTSIPSSNACKFTAPFAGAYNDGCFATGYGSHAEGQGTTAGVPLTDAVITPGGTLVTIPSDVREYFQNGDPVGIIRKTPTLYPVLQGSIASAPVFAAGSTTFNLASAVDATTTTIALAACANASLSMGRAAHAEGDHCFALGGAGSHAEGSFCQAFGYGAHAEGGGSIAYGNESHAEGETTEARGIDAHSEGGTTIAQGFCSHAEGGAGATPGPIASGSSSHAEGISSLTGFAPVAYTVAAGGTLISIAGDHAAEFVNGSHVGFTPNSPSRGLTQYSDITSVPVFAAGFTTFTINVPIDNWSTGGWTADGNSFGRGAHAEGSAIARGSASHAEGIRSLATGDASHAEGSLTQATGPESHAEGDQSQATGNAAHAEGHLTLASATGSHAEGGGSQATALYAHAEGSASVASQTFAHAEGQNTTASGVASHAEGQGTSATTVGTHAEGGLTTASGFYSHAEGISCLAAGQSSHASGLESKTLNENEDCFAGGKFSALGDAQLRRLVIKGLTPGSAPGESVILVSGGSTAVFVVASKSYMVKVRGIATKMGLGAAARQSFSWEYDFTVDCDSAGNLTISALTPLCAIVTGAAFVGATVTAVSSGPGALNVTFTNSGILTIQARIAGYIELVEVLGT